MTGISSWRGILSGMAVVAALACASSVTADDHKELRRMIQRVVDKVDHLAADVDDLSDELDELADDVKDLKKGQKPVVAPPVAMSPKAPETPLPPDKKKFRDDQNVRLEDARLVGHSGCWCVCLKGWKRRGTEVQLALFEGESDKIKYPTYLLCSIDACEKSDEYETFVERIEVKASGGMIKLQQKNVSLHVSEGPWQLAK